MVESNELALSVDWTLNLKYWLESMSETVLKEGATVVCTGVWFMGFEEGSCLCFCMQV